MEESSNTPCYYYILVNPFPPCGNAPLTGSSGHLFFGKNANSEEFYGGILWDKKFYCMP